jgi:H+/Cl- antiporter ClcA
LSESQLRKPFSEQFHLLIELGRWIPVSALVGLMAGSASALLLVSLNYATYLRERHTWLILLLAPAGWLIGFPRRPLAGSVSPELSRLSELPASSPLVWHLQLRSTKVR